MHRKSERNERRAHLSTLIINVATGNLAPIHLFPRNFQPHTGLRRDSPDICLSTISIFLPFSLFFEIHTKHCRLSQLYFLTRPFFSFIHPHLNRSGAVPVVWTTARILFRRLRTTFPARKSLLRFSSRRRQFLPAVFLLQRYRYIHI